jgi:hypothetical protein
MPTISLGEPGFFDAFTNQERSKNMMSKYGLDPTAGAQDINNIGRANRNAGFAGQADAMGMYQQQALGRGPSAAAAMWQQQNQRNTTDALALAARGRGGNIAGQGQQALAANTYANMQTNQGLAALRAQEQQAGMAGYAGMANQISGQGLQYSQLGAQTSLGAAQNQLGWYSADRGMDMQQDMNSHQRTMDWMNQGREWGQAISGAAGGAMGAGMMSDERSKQGIRPTTLAASQAVGDITPAVYGYKPGMGPGGERIGPMAQDLERNPYTASLVQEGPDGLKRVDIGGLAALATAASAEQEGRIRALEQQNPGMTNAVTRTAPRMSSQYMPDDDIDFGSRVRDARGRGPFGIPQRQQMATIDPFASDARGSSGLGQLLSDKRAKTGMASTISQQKVRNAGGY